MQSDYIVIGSGFAARQLIKTLRKADAVATIAMIAADSCDEYSKPELSHVISQSQSAADLTRQSAAAFSAEYNVMVSANTKVNAIDTATKTITANGQRLTYGKLIICTGSRAIVPLITGAEHLITLNSQAEYEAHQDELQTAQRVLIIGGGLIGTELAQDFIRADKTVTIVDRSTSLLSALMPPEISGRLQNHFLQSGAELMFNSSVKAIAKTDEGYAVAFTNGQLKPFDAVVSAIGLAPNVELAQAAGLQVNRGIVVGGTLQTSAPDVYALGDCAELNGKLLPFLQPVVHAVNTLVKNLTGGDAVLSLPVMLVKVKTPDMPFQVAGELGRKDLRWQITVDLGGLLAQGFDDTGALKAFAVSEEYQKQAFAFLKQLNS